MTIGKLLTNIAIVKGEEDDEELNSKDTDPRYRNGDEEGDEDEDEESDEDNDDQDVSSENFTEAVDQEEES